MFTNDPEYVYESATALPPVSSPEHLPIMIKTSINHYRNTQNSQNYTRWKYHLKDAKKMSDPFLLEEWNHVFVSSNINEVWYKWKDQFFSTVESFIPREDKQNFKTCHGRLAPPWFSNDIRRLVRAKNRLFKRAQSSGEPDHWRVYCIARNKASNAVKAAKKKHLSVQAKVLADPNCSSSEWWRVAKEMCGLKANPCQPEVSLLL